jgi:hypothetical protein
MLCMRLATWGPLPCHRSSLRVGSLVTPIVLDANTGGVVNAA